MSKLLERRPPYRRDPVLRDDEVLVDFRRTDARGQIILSEGEQIIGTEGNRYPRKPAGPAGYSFGGGTSTAGRYVVRKKKIEAPLVTVVHAAPTYRVLGHDLTESEATRLRNQLDDALASEVF